MKILDVLEQLEESQLFKDWKKENNQDYLANIFKFIQNEETPWQIGYYNKETDLITTFNVGDDITKNDASEVFKKEDSIDMLKTDDVKIDYDQALLAATNFQKENYPSDMPMKIIVLLQNKGTTMYNITFITQTMKTLNMHVSTLDGSILESKVTSLMDFKKE
ncbi:hypothetical protein C0585_07980 [Candidatus Woesearchaeota archaeon]|nr:MAG: hypothetical protein C0585_07980 [Candidatus Woesearchaeota archaeon]